MDTVIKWLLVLSTGACLGVTVRLISQGEVGGGFIGGLITTVGIVGVVVLHYNPQHVEEDDRR